MYRNAALMIALFSLAGPLLKLSANAEESGGGSAAGAHWGTGNGTLHLIDDRGTEKHVIKLERRTATDDPGLVVRETKAIVSRSKRVALVIDSYWDTERDGLLGGVRCFDSSGTVRWERHGIDVDRIRLSDDGETSLVVTRNEDGCSPVEDTSCTVSAQVLDGRGKELFDFGPFTSINGYVLSRNGRFGWISAWEKGGAVYVFFNAAKGVVTKKKASEIPGGPQLGEDGIVKLVKNVYDFKASPEPTGGPKIRRVDVLGVLDLR